MKNSTDTLEASWAVTYKTKYTLTISSSNHAPWYLPKGVENLCPHKNLHTEVYSSLFMIAKSWRQPRCSLVDNR